MDQELLKEWQRSVEHAETLLGFQDWLRHKQEADEFSPQPPANVYSRREHRSA